MANSTSRFFVLKNTFRILALAFFITSLSSCGANTSSEKKESPINQQSKEYTSAYICPTHCEGSGSETKGICPKCGMDYVQNDEHSHRGHE